MISNHSIVIFVLSILLFSGVSNFQNTKRDNLSDKLTFVSYPDATGDKISSSELSEIMVYDFATKELSRLTNDLSKDSHPSWSPKGQQIIFESKRPYEGELAENGSSHLYLYNFRSGELRQFDKDFSERFGEKIGSENLTPVWSSINNEVAFVTKFDKKNSQGDVGFYLNVYDLDTDKLTRVSKCGNLISLKWIEEKELFIYDSLFKSTFLSGITIFNYRSKKVKKISDTNVSYSLVDVSPDRNKLLLQGKDTENGDTIVFTYDLRSDSLNNEYNFGSKEISVRAFGMKNNKLVIQKGSVSKNQTIFNLYHFDIENKTSTQLTTDGKFKKDFSVYRSRN